MDHYSLKLFLHLSENLHFGKTGQACNISPSALSRQIQRMEDETGHRLFERDNRKVSLTPAGRLFREYASEVLEKWQELLNTLAADTDRLKGEIRIYCSVTASLSILPELLERFRAAYSSVSIRLQTGDAGIALRKVIQGEADVAVSALPQTVPKVLSHKVLTRVSPVFVAPNVPWEFSSAVETGIPWDRIPLILSERGLIRKKIDAWFKQKKIEPNIYARVSGNEAILAMVALGGGVGVVPGLVMENSPFRHRVTSLNVTPPISPYPVGICVLKRKMKRRLVQAFWEMVSEFPS